MSAKSVRTAVIVCLLCAAAVAIVVIAGAQKRQDAARDAAVGIPPDVQAKIPPAVLARIQKDGFSSLPPEMRAKILQLMGGEPLTQAPAQDNPSTANLEPTGANFPHLVPLTDLGSGTYKGYQGGLYAGGSNEPSPEYLKSRAGYTVGTPFATAARSPGLTKAVLPTSG